MSKFKTDNGGKAVKIEDAKIVTSENASTWNTRLSQIGTANLKNNRVIICTYSLPDLEYSKQVFDKRSKNVMLIVNEKFRDRAKALENIYPDLEIHLKHDVHAKMVLVEPQTVWLSSANFGKSDWFEHTIGIHSEEVYKFYLEQINRYLNQ